MATRKKKPKHNKIEFENGSVIELGEVAPDDKFYSADNFPIEEKEEFQEAYKPEEWIYVVKRTTHPSQIVRVLTHQSAQTYFKDSTQTEHNTHSCDELDQIIGGKLFDEYERFGAALLKEAKTPEGLITGVKLKTLTALDSLYAGLKAFSISLSKDPNYGDVVQMTLTIAASNGTYETTISLVKNGSL